MSRNSLLISHHLLLASFLCIFWYKTVECAEEFRQNPTPSADELVEEILTSGNYNSGLLPPGTQPVRVQINFLIRSIDDINDNRMDFTVQTTFWQAWSDRRLIFNHTDPVTMPGVNNRIWTPDLFFPNEKNARQPTTMKPNNFLRIFPNGTVLYSNRMSLTLSCPMSLRFFPLDKQECFIPISSYSYTRDKMEFEFGSDNPVRFYNGNGFAQLPRFKLKGHTHGVCSNMTITTFSGTYTCLTIKLEFNRQVGHYLNSMYMPTTMFVTISWLSFWIGVNALEARLSLGVTILLTMATQIYGSTQSGPAVSYIKALDVWNELCLTFITLSIFEVSYLMYLKQRRGDLSTLKNRVGSNSATPIVVGSGVGRMMKETLMTSNTDIGVGGNEIEIRMMKIDRISRYLFPAAFVVFSILYWSVLLLIDQGSKQKMGDLYSYG